MYVTEIIYFNQVTSSQTGLSTSQFFAVSSPARLAMKSYFVRLELGEISNQKIKGSFIFSSDKIDIPTTT